MVRVLLVGPARKRLSERVDRYTSRFKSQTYVDTLSILLVC